PCPPCRPAVLPPLPFTMLRIPRLVLALALAATAPAAAQNQLLDRLRPAPDSFPKAAPVAEAPTTIAPIDIPLRASSAFARLSEIQALIRPMQAVRAVERSAGQVLDSVNALAESQLSLPTSQMTRRALNDLVAEWDRWAARVDGWTRTFRDRTAALDSARQELESARALWRRTAQRARTESAPAEVIDQAEQVVRLLDGEDQAVLARLRELVEVELTLTQARLVIDEGRSAVDAAIEQERRQLFRTDAPSLAAQVASGELPGLGETIRSRWGMAMSGLRAFLEAEQGGVVLHLLGTALLLFAILWLRRSSGWPDGEPAKQLSRDERWLLQHPLASTLLFALLATGILYPRAASAVYDLVMLAAAIPLIRVTPSLIPPDLQRLARRGSSLFVIDRVVTVLLHSTPWHRVGSLLVAILGMALTLVAIRRYQAFDEVTRRRPTPRWLFRGGVAAVVLLGIAIIANLVGNVTLALVVTSGVASLPYLGFLLYAAAQVADGVVSVGVRVTADDLKFVERHGPAIARRVTQVVHVAAFATWLWFVLYLFYLWDPTRALVAGILGAKWSLGAATVSLAGILLFFLTIWIGALLGRWIAIVLEADILDRLDLPRGVPVTIASIVRYTLTAIAFFLALAAVGVNVGQLAIIGGALSVGIGFGLQTIVNNFISGLILAFERPLAIGDVVQLGELQGEVRSIGIRASVIRTFDGADVIVPNGQLISNELINWTRSDRTRRLEIPVGVAYGTDPGAVISLLAEVAAGHARVRPHPAPLCLLQGFGESSLDFLLRFWTEADDFPVVRSEVRVAVYEALRAAKIEIPFPQRDVHVRTLPPTQGAT
ncbi:MAG TPA: mechanosensitive ion channel domain-containing protein, partial [Gemmatimonadales bacterium]